MELLLHSFPEGAAFQQLKCLGACFIFPHYAFPSFFSGRRQKRTFSCMRHRWEMVSTSCRLLVQFLTHPKLRGMSFPQEERLSRSGALFLLLSWFWFVFGMRNQSNKFAYSQEAEQLNASFVVLNYFGMRKDSWLAYCEGGLRVEKGGGGLLYSNKASGCVEPLGGFPEMSGTLDILTCILLVMIPKGESHEHT